jgi:hypothetical protein
MHSRKYNLVEQADHSTAGTATVLLRPWLIEPWKRSACPPSCGPSPPSPFLAGCGAETWRLSLVLRRAETWLRIGALTLPTLSVSTSSHTRRNYASSPQCSARERERAVCDKRPAVKPPASRRCSPCFLLADARQRVQLDAPRHLLSALDRFYWRVFYICAPVGRHPIYMYATTASSDQVSLQHSATRLEGGSEKLLRCRRRKQVYGVVARKPWPSVTHVCGRT